MQQLGTMPKQRALKKHLHTAEKYAGPPYFARGARSGEVEGGRAPE